jgi:hypothetical protein
MNAQEWFERFPELGRMPVFRLRVRLGNLKCFMGHGRCFCAVIQAYEGPETSAGGRNSTHTTLYCSLTFNGWTGFPRESFYVGIPHGHGLDGDYAKAAVMGLFALKPGDTDDEFFADYTPEQLAFVERYGEELSIVARERYGEF